jgi:hypothetical protein
MKTMKKIFTLALGVLMTTMLFAADRRPTVILNSVRNYEVVIDGRSYASNGRTISLDHLYNGRHKIQVFEVRRSVFGKQRRMVSQSFFRLRQNDLMIRVTMNGQIQFKERNSRNFGGRNNGYRDRDFNDNDGWMNGTDKRGFDDDDRNFREDRENRF